MGEHGLRLLAEVDTLRQRVARYRAGVLQAAATEQAMRDAPASDKARRKHASAVRAMHRDKAAFLKSVYDHLEESDLMVAIADACHEAGITGEEE
jgi:hypothetical protein